jgi:exopolysaccharide biosynthesis polyprenyl glycosylphosphotransferase
MGWDDAALALCTMLEQQRGLGYRVVGVIDDHAELGATVHGDSVVVGRSSDVVALVDQGGVTGVIIVTSAVDGTVANAVARDVADRGFYVELSSALRDVAVERLGVRGLGRFPMVTVGPMHRGGWRARAKRSFDVVGAIVALVLASPLLLLTAIAIKLDSRGPVLFRQQRVGKDGEPFDLLKFRSMVVGAEDRLHELQELNEASGPLFKMAEDPRVTRVGRVLRRLSIDEIPQFWTVLRGKMSIVGPRPALPTEVHAWSPELHQRLRVKPGITGMWQVSGRSDATFDDYVRLDLYYVDNWSLITDLVIMAKTIPTVLSRKGAA